MNPAFEAATVSFAAASPARDSLRRHGMPEWLRRMFARPARAPAGAIDRPSGLLNREGFFAACEDAMRHRGEDAVLAMVVLDCDDLREVAEIYGHAIGRRVLDKLIRRLRAAAGHRGLVGRTGPVQFSIALPAASTDRAQRAVQRALGKPARIEFDAGDSEIVLVPDVHVDAAMPGEGGAPALHREMCGELARMQKDERRRLHYLASERERHSRPMSLPRA